MDFDSGDEYSTNKFRPNQHSGVSGLGQFDKMMGD
jgi:hypothetical protein